MAAFFARSGWRVCASIAAAPSRKFVDVEALQRRRQQADGAHLRGAAADPIPHREARQPAGLSRRTLSSSLPSPVTATACLRNCSPAFSKAAPWPRACRCASPWCRPISRSRRRAFAPSPAPIRSSTRSKPSGSVLSKKKISIGSRVATERVGDELRSERGAADADQQDVGEALARFVRRDLAAVDGGGEVFDARVGFNRYRRATGR